MSPRNEPRGASIDPAEVERFAAIADQWWDPDGAAGPLHRLNPTRLAYVRDRCCARFGRDVRARRPLAGLRLVDIGCGGGLLCEPMARLGADVVGADPAAENVKVARAHAHEADLEIDYRQATAEELAEGTERFDIVLNLEVIEHVAAPESLVSACATLLSPGGAMVLSTLNRSLRSLATAIVGAEYVLRWLPRGTHRWDRFVRPSELARYVRKAGLRVEDIKGMSYAPVAGEWHVSTDVGVNYLAFAVKD